MNIDPHRLLVKLLLAASAFALLSVAQAEDVLVLYRPDAVVHPVLFADLVLEQAMRRTQRTYGAFRIERYTENLVRERLMDEMIKGSTINTAVVASQTSWETQLLPVWIPIDMGLSSFRIGLVRRDGQARVSRVRNEDDLKKLKIGVGLGWSSRQVFEANGYQLEMAANQEALTKMLLAERLDYFPRGVNEVFGEFDELTAANPDLAIESDLVLEFPLPTYIFVSPSAPRLARRLTEGLESMVRDGSLLKMVTSFHADILQRAKLCSRRIIHVNNPLLSDRNPLQRKALWLDPYDRKSGLCEPRGASAAKRK